LPSLTLYGTSACHLCEVAEEMLAMFEAEGMCSLNKVDIADDDQLLERYGLRIPVLANSAGTELNWPFSPDQVMQLVSQSS